MTWTLWFVAAFVYAHLYRLLHRYAGLNLRGLGWLMRRIGKDLVLNVGGVKTFMYSPIAGSNAMHLIGRWNEPETHLFLNAVLRGCSAEVTFIDVGANVGEMVLDLARHQRVGVVYAFEPVASCLYVLTVSIAINKLSNIYPRPIAISEVKGTVKFASSRTNPSSSGINGTGDVVMDVPATTLDDEFPRPVKNPILLLDVEGAELSALRGAQRFVTRDRPLIVFEYNHVSRRHFTLNDVQSLLGPDYEIFRLRTTDGMLDQVFEKTWNCVAVHRTTQFYQLSRSSIRQERR